MLADLERLFQRLIDAVQGISGGGGGGGGAVTVADGSDATQGAVADAPWSGTGDATVVAVLKRLAALLAGAGSIQTPALRGTPIAAAMTTSLTTTTRTQVPWVSGREPDAGEAGYITSLVVIVTGNAGGYLSLHDGDSATVIGQVPLPNKSADADTGGAVIPIPDALVITAGNALYVTASAAQDGLRVTAFGFEGAAAPA